MTKNEELMKIVAEIKFKYRLSQKKIAEEIGVSAQYLSDLVNGRYAFNDDMRRRLSRRFNDVYWFEPEENKSEVKQTMSPLNIPSNAVPSEEIVEIEYAGENHNAGIFYRDKNTGQLYISVPHMPYAARGEFPNLADSLEPLSEWGREIYKVDRMAKGRYISFDVRGDSMDNGMRKCLQDGDKVLVRELERDYWRTLRAGDHRFWVLVFGSSVLIKEIASFDSNTGIITCHSLNPSPEYQDFTLSLDDVRHLYYVIKYKPHDETPI